MSTPSTRVREATADDVTAILRLIHELAAYEREPDAVATTEAYLHAALFPADGHPTAWCHLAEVEGPAVDGEGGGPQVVGIALWFLTFSTWVGKNGIWLEDLFVLPEHRGLGLGKALLQRLAALCVERGYGRLEWTVLDWNEPSIAFYRSLGAVAMDEWTTNRLDGAALARLGGAGRAS